MAGTLLFAGGGNMGSAVIAGLITAGWSPEDIWVIEPFEATRDALARRHPGLVLIDDAEALAGDHPTDAVLVVKPAQALTVAGRLAAHGVTRLLSLVAGLSTVHLETAMGPNARVIRAMPNTPSLVGSGVAAISSGLAATPSDLDWADTILSAVGICVRVPESDLDAVTGLSGSGPAYVFLVAEAMVAAGIAAGLEPELARRLAIATVIGAAQLLDGSGESPETLRQRVTSPGGTTEVGLGVLQDRGLFEIFEAAVGAAAERSRQMGQS